MTSKDYRIILDTNLWISFLITKDYSHLDKLLTSGGYKLVFSPELFEEFIEVSSRPKLRKYFKNSDLTELVDIIEDFADFISVKTKVNICRDEKDNFLLALAIESNAKYLISGDKDLLVLKKIGKTKIITFTEFIKSTTR